MIKKAFTLVELIVVVILIGIISSIAVSSFREDKLALATYQVLDHIRYTQHLAISDHKFDPKDDYYLHYQKGSTGNYPGQYHLARWQIRFFQSSGDVYYYVYSDRDRNSDADTSDHIEAARDPFDSQYFIMYDSKAIRDERRRNPNVLLSQKYGIVSVTPSDSCKPVNATNPTKVYISFDEKGRPYKDMDYGNTGSVYKHRLESDCNITLTHEDGRSSVITIYPETGYAEITKLE